MRLTHCLLSLVASLFTMASNADAEDAKPTTLRVMSFNIRYGTAKDGDNHWDKRRDFLVETIRKFDPDLLGTQETLGFQRDYLAEQLDGYQAIGVGRDDGKDEGEMTAVLYRTERFELLDHGHFWLSETPDVPGSKNWDAALTRMVTWLKLQDRKSSDQPPLYFFNTHFDHIGREARAQSAMLLKKRIEELSGQPPVVLSGDFNEAEGSRPYHALFDPVDSMPPLLQDTYRAANPVRGSEEGTFSGFLVTNRGAGRIDWIACTRQFKVKNAVIDRTEREGRTPSDHFPVTAVLERVALE
jgi:endonuclease/exonuclease/phosphatase family metal-dependent hydrolase